MKTFCKIFNNSGKLHRQSVFANHLSSPDIGLEDHRDNRQGNKQPSCTVPLHCAGRQPLTGETTIDS